jgi:hypothetical protein
MGEILKMLRDLPLKEAVRTGQMLLSLAAKETEPLYGDEAQMMSMTVAAVSAAEALLSRNLG